MMGVLLAHRWSQLVVLLGVLGCVTSTTSAPGTSDCLDSLDPIRTAEAILLDDGELRTYVLCPDTVFPVAKSFNQDGTPKYAQYPLILGRSNIHILCGVDGRSENNCVLTGGLLHVGFFDEWETGRAVTNALVQGLTFHDAKNTNVLAENKGGLTLRDCLFKVRICVSQLLDVTSCDVLSCFAPFCSHSSFIGNITRYRTTTIYLLYTPMIHPPMILVVVDSLLTKRYRIVSGSAKCPKRSRPSSPCRFPF